MEGIRRVTVDAQHVDGFWIARCLRSTLTHVVEVLRQPVDRRGPPERHHQKHERREDDANVVGRTLGEMPAKLCARGMRCQQKGLLDVGKQRIFHDVRDGPLSGRWASDLTCNHDRGLDGGCQQEHEAAQLPRIGQHRERKRVGCQNEEHANKHHACADAALDAVHTRAQLLDRSPEPIVKMRIQMLHVRIQVAIHLAGPALQQCSLRAQFPQKGNVVTELQQLGGVGAFAETRAEASLEAQADRGSRTLCMVQEKIGDRDITQAQW